MKKVAIALLLATAFSATAGQEDIDYTQAGKDWVNRAKDLLNTPDAQFVIDSGKDMALATWEGTKGAAIGIKEEFQSGSRCAIAQSNDEAIKNSQLFNEQSSKMIQAKIDSGDSKAWSMIPDLVFITKRTNLSPSAVLENGSVYNKNVNPDKIGELAYEFWQGKSYKCNEDAAIRRSYKLQNKQEPLKNSFDHALDSYLALLQYSGYANATLDGDALFAELAGNK
jgi:hypothetical protein